MHKPAQVDLAAPGTSVPSAYEKQSSATKQEPWIAEHAAVKERHEKQRQQATDALIALRPGQQSA
jgi:hypothetical protein